MVCAECVLISENAAFLQTQGKGQVSAFALASCVALLIPIAAAFKVSKGNDEPNLWALIGKWCFVTALVCMQVWFASQTAIAPQMTQTMKETDRVLLAEYQAQIQQYDSQIAGVQKQINSYSDNYRTRKAELSEKQAKLLQEKQVVLSGLRTVTENAGRKPSGIQALFNNTTIAATIAYRLALEISVIFLAVCLRRHFSAMPEYQGNSSNHADLNPIPALHIQENTADILEPGDSDQQSVNPRVFVLEHFPNAVCKSSNGRKGPFYVYADTSEKIVLGTSRLNIDAWDSAARKLMERRAA